MAVGRVVAIFAAVAVAAACLLPAEGDAVARLLRAGRETPRQLIAKLEKRADKIHVLLERSQKVKHEMTELHSTVSHIDSLIADYAGNPTLEQMMGKMDEFAKAAKGYHHLGRNMMMNYSWKMLTFMLKPFVVGGRALKLSVTFGEWFLGRFINGVPSKAEVKAWLNNAAQSLGATVVDTLEGTDFGDVVFFKGAVQNLIKHEGLYSDMAKAKAVFDTKLQELSDQWSSFSSETRTLRKQCEDRVKEIQKEIEEIIALVTDLKSQK